MALFASIPTRCGIAVMAGQVAVYDPDDLARHGLIEGGFYVVEYQRTRAGMSWEAFHAQDRRRLDTSREVVRIERFPKHPDYWRLRFCESMWADGPIDDINLADMIVGRVVGLYSPGSEVRQRARSR